MITRIRPLFALFARAVRDDVRSKFPPVMRTLAVLFVLLIIWGNQRRFDIPDAGQIVLMMIALVNLAVGTLFGLGSFSSAITEEKEEQTMGLLLMTRLNPLAILLGKSTARLSGGLLFIIVQIPFMVLCVALGGVELEQILKVYAILAAYLVFLCNLCLLWSVFCRRASSAVSISLACSVALYLIPIFAANRPRYYDRVSSWQPLYEYLQGVNPFFHTVQVIGGRMGFFPTGNSIPFHLIAAAVLFGISWLMFDRFCSGNEEVLPRRRKNGGTAPRRRVARTWEPALAWKDFNFLTGGWRGMGIRSVAYSVITGAIIFWVWHEQRAREWEVAGAIAKWCGLVFFTAELGALASRIFGLERQHHTLDGLLGLPIPTAKIAWQKVFGCVPAFIPSVALWWAGAAFETKMKYLRGYRFRGYDDLEVALLVLCVAEYVFFPVLVAAFSLRMRRGGLLSAFGIMLFGNILIFVLPGLLGFYSRGAKGWFHFVTAVLVVMTLVFAARIPSRLEACAAEN